LRIITNFSIPDNKILESVPIASAIQKLTGNEEDRIKNAAQKIHDYYESLTAKKEEEKKENGDDNEEKGEDEITITEQPNKENETEGEKSGESDPIKTDE